MRDRRTIRIIATEPGEFCDFCEREIHVGEQFHFSSDLEDGKFFTQHLCLPCARMWDDAADHAREPVSQHDVFAHLSQKYCKDCQHYCPTQMMRNCQCHRIRAHYGEAQQGNEGAYHATEDLARELRQNQRTHQQHGSQP